jgi:rhamnulokinase
MAHLAVDIGANGGKAYLGRFRGGLSVEEIHRFDNHPVERDGRLVWDIERLSGEIETSIERADSRSALETVGIDTWGLDFGLVGDGELLRVPSSYRDPSVTSTRDGILERFDRREIFEATGINNWNTPNTLWQYHHLVAREPDVVEQTDGIVMMPQLLSALLGGRTCGELTIASTTQMLDPRTGTWAEGMLETLDLPTNPLPEVVPPGGGLGKLSPAISDGLDRDADIVLPASHDTASAVAGMPLNDDGRVFLSTGTWFIPGVELPEPVIDDDAFEAGVSNELGADGTIRLVKNVTGFFLLEQCRNAWRSVAAPTEYERLLLEASEAEPFGPLVDPDADLFDIRSEMPATIREFCLRTDQRPPRNRGQMVRCILESLAAKTALVVEDLTTVADTEADCLHVGGGGVRNDLFCELLASALGRPVLAGPAEATAVGNLLTQAVATDAIEDLAVGRQRVADALPPTEYEPDRETGWADAKARMRDLVSVSVRS